MTGPASPNRIKKIVIVGGGTAGWMSAAALRCVLGPRFCEIELVESDEIGTVGVGEATLPTLHIFHNKLNISEVDFVRSTKATFKLGIDFRDWGHIGNRFFHGFGDFGPFIQSVAPYQYWLKLRSGGDAAPLGDYSVPTVMAQLNRCAQPHPDPKSPFSAFIYAYQFDASLYARFLREYAERRGVVRTSGRIVDVVQRGLDGFVEALLLEDGRRIEGDLFVDCSGFVSLLLGKALNVGFEDWSQWLVCDRALAVPCESVSPLTPYTRSTARDAGWQWRIPLQHRIGNGYVYCSKFANDDDAAHTLMQNLDGKPLADPKTLRFTAGRRQKSWDRNCVAIGLSGGFMEPLESTSISLIQNGIGRLIEYFPDKQFDPVMAREFNRQTDIEYERIRDFLIAHYCFTDRRDTELWRYCSSMQLPESLAYKAEVFRTRGRPVVYDSDGFKEASWISIYNGLGVVPRTYDSLVDRLSEDEIRHALATRREVLRRGIETMPSHEQFLARNFHSS